MPKERQPIAVSGSFLTPEEKDNFKKVSKQLGNVRAVKGISLEGCDFLVVGEEKALKRSVKVLRSMVDGVHIVNTKWVNDSRDRGEWILNPRPEHLTLKKAGKIFLGMTLRVSDPLAQHLIKETGGFITNDMKVDVSPEDLIYESIFTNCLSAGLKKPLNNQGETTRTSSAMKAHQNTVPSTNATTQSQLSLDLLKVSGGVAPDKSGCPYLKLQVQVTEGIVPKQILLEKPTTTVGRKQKYNDILIDSSQISRRHAAFNKNANGTVTVTDLKSTNGFFVNGVKREEWTISEGDIVILGGGGVTQAGWKAESIPSECVYRFHSSGGFPTA